jgi:protein-S-isoprenylcysteine O-methyltransferase Ste14
MRRLLPGCLAFAFFFLSDWNDWKKGYPALRWCFPAGTVLLSLNILALSLQGSPLPGILRGVFFAFAAGFLALLIHSLFFALPAEDAYTRPGQIRRTCASGVYALCRHPGVLWLAGLLLCLRPAAGLPLSAAALFTVLNVLLVLFEDRTVFPSRLEGYADYRRTTPFLLPTPTSIRACFGKI